MKKLLRPLEENRFVRGLGMRHEFVNNTTMTLNIKREKNLPITAAVFQRGQVLLSKKAGKGFSVKKKIKIDFGY